MVSYIGTVGLAHGLETVVKAAERLQTAAPEVLFLVVGDGAERTRIVSAAREKNLSNIHFIPQQLREKIPLYICASDACLVLLKKSEVFETVIPTKMLEFMSCGRPVIVGVDGQARSIVETSQSGVYVPAENPDALCDAVLHLSQRPALRQAMGRNGREYIVQNLSRQRTAEDYLRVLCSLMGKNAAATQAAA